MHHATPNNKFTPKDVDILGQAGHRDASIQGQMLNLHNWHGTMMENK